MTEAIKKGVISSTTLILLAILSAGLTVFWVVFTVFLPTIATCTQNVSNLINAPGVELMGGPFIMFLFAMVLMRVPSIRRHLTTTNLVYLYVTMSVSICNFECIFWSHSIRYSAFYSILSYLRHPFSSPIMA